MQQGHMAGKPVWGRGLSNFILRELVLAGFEVDEDVSLFFDMLDV